MKLSPGNGVRGLLPDGDRAEDRINVFKTKNGGKHYETQKSYGINHGRCYGSNNTYRLRKQFFHNRDNKGS